MEVDGQDGLDRAQWQSGSTQRMRVGFKHEAGLSIFECISFSDKIPAHPGYVNYDTHAWAWTRRHDVAWRAPKSVRACIGPTQKHTLIHAFLAQIWTKSRLVWLRRKLSLEYLTSMPGESSG